MDYLLKSSVCHRIEAIIFNEEIEATSGPRPRVRAALPS